MELHLPVENTASQLTQLLCKRRSVALTCLALMTKQHFSQMLDSLGTEFHRLQNIARKLFCGFRLFNAFCHTSLHLDMPTQRLLRILCVTRSEERRVGQAL